MTTTSSRIDASTSEAPEFSQSILAHLHAMSIQPVTKFRARPNGARHLSCLASNCVWKLPMNVLANARLETGSM